MDEMMDARLRSALEEQSSEWLREAVMKCVNEPCEDWVLFRFMTVSAHDMAGACVRELARRDGMTTSVKAAT
jgi:hypothetical protein